MLPVLVWLPVTPRVPPTVVLPVLASTWNLFVLTEKLPVLSSTPAIETAPLPKKLNVGFVVALPNDIFSEALVVVIFK
jgi:hypothetical protein